MKKTLIAALLAMVAMTGIARAETVTVEGKAYDTFGPEVCAGVLYVEAKVNGDSETVNQNRKIIQKIVANYNLSSRDVAIGSLIAEDLYVPRIQMRPTATN